MKSIIYKSHWIMIILVLPLLAALGSAVECGSTPTNSCTVSQNTVFNTGTYNLPSGIDITAGNIVLDCNGSILNGSGSSDGIYNRDSVGVTIKNCIIQNYNLGIYLHYSNSPNCNVPNPTTNNTLKNNTIIGTSNGIKIFTYSDWCNLVGSANTNHLIQYNNLKNNSYGMFIRGKQNNIRDNGFTNNSIGIFIDRTERNNITGNLFLNNSNVAIDSHKSSSSNVIWNNSISFNNISYQGTSNIYCYNNLGNNYSSGSDGPTCQCMPLTNGLTITSANTTFCERNYTLPNGIFMEDYGQFDCNGAIINSGSAGFSGQGIKINGKSATTVNNCTLLNYGRGVQLEIAPTNPCIGLGEPSNNVIKNLRINSSTAIYLRGSVSICGARSTNNLFRNNEFLEGTNTGFYIEYANSNNITENIIRGSSNGVLITGASTNLVHYNNFLNSSGNDVVGNKWNISEGGNYWSEYDSSGEGCNNVNGDQFCDNPYNISGTANSKDYKPFVVQDGWLLGAQASQPLPVQVIADVDMVKGKTTLIRIPVTFKSVLSNDTITPNVTVYWNGTFVGQNLTTNFSYNQTKNVDFWYVPTNAGTNLPIEVRVNGLSANGINYTDANSKSVDVVKTRNLTISFVSVDDPLTFEDYSLDSIDFIDKVYPIKDNGIIYELNRTNIESTSFEHNDLGIHKLLYRIHKSTYVAGKLPERSVGVVPANWFYNNLGTDYATTLGYSKPLYHGAVLVQEFSGDFFDHTSAHELGHTYGLCDEYDESDWNRQDGFFLNLCPNGDLDNDGGLDSICTPGGCPTSTLEPLSGRSDNTILHNLMGSNITSNIWVAPDSYTHLLNEFEHESPEFQQNRIVIGGIMNRSSNISSFDNFYTLESGLAENLSEHLSGDYSIQAFNGSNLVYTFRFNVSFLDVFFGGNTSENNETSFIFTLPYYTNLTSFVLKEAGTTKDVKNVSFNAPSIILNSVIANVTYSNEIINISWNSSDSDSTNLSYALLLSSDNGINYNTLDFDFNYTNYSIDTLDLQDGENYKIKILVTDGVRTNFTTTNQSFEIDNDLQIRSFDVIYTNLTERIFRININNTLSSTISNISWEFDLGQDVKTSQILFNLEPKEEVDIFVYHNYTTGGNYNLSFRAFSGNYIEGKIKSINV